MAALASDWLRQFRLLLWNHWKEFNETWQEARYQRLLPSLCFRADRKNKMAALALWLAETFSTSSLKPLNGIQRHLTGSKISSSSTKFVFFGPIGKTRWPPWSLIGWDIFDFSSETAERNSKKLDRKQDLNVLYQVCVFRADKKKQDAALFSDWLRHLRLLLRNRWTEFKETWQEARSQRLLPSLCFSGWWVSKYFCPGWSVKKAAHCTQDARYVALLASCWFIFPVECDFFFYHTILVWSDFRCIPRGDRLIRVGGGLSWHIVFSMSSARKFIFRYFDAKILIFIRNKIWKKKKCWGLDWMGGGVRNVS